jgi:8-oxo-dGTP pyrophosphatase MutT (NUDIX family)
MYIKIYFGDKPLFLTNEITPEIEPFAHHDDAVLIDEFSAPGVNSMIHEMRQEKVHAGIYLHQDLQELKKAFWKKFTILETAGGLVFNEKGELLIIFRRGKWDLPKGKIDPGETREACAIREVNEETGLQQLSVEKPLITTYHSYDESGKHILKENHWFIMHVKGRQQLKAQEEEDITEVKMIQPKDVSGYTGNMFPSVRDVFKAAGLA